MRKNSYVGGTLAVLILIFSAGAQTNFRVPAPKIELVSMNKSTTGVDATGEPYIEITLKVTNWKSFNPALFAPSPDLPPCGESTKAPRTWVGIFGNQGGNDANLKQIGNHCGIFDPEGLQKIIFNVERGKVPSGLLIKLSDQKTGKVYPSNCINPDTGQVCLFAAGSSPVVIPAKKP